MAIKQGFFLVDIEKVERKVPVRQVVGYKDIPIYDEVGTVIATRKEPVYETAVQSFTEERPRLGEDIVDWKIIAEEEPPGTRVVIHVLMRDSPALERLKKHSSFLGESYRDLWRNHPKIAKQVLQYEVEEDDSETGLKVKRRVSVAEAEKRGVTVAPKQIKIPHRWLGVPISERLEGFDLNVSN